MSLEKRELLKALTLGSGVLTVMPVVWKKPAVKSVILPAHASATAGGEPCNSSVTLPDFSIACSDVPIPATEILFTFALEDGCLSYTEQNTGSTEQVNPVPANTLSVWYFLDDLSTDIGAITIRSTDDGEQYSLSCGSSSTTTAPFSFPIPVNGVPHTVSFQFERTSTTLDLTGISVDPNP